MHELDLDAINFDGKPEWQLEQLSIFYELMPGYIKDGIIRTVEIEDETDPRGTPLTSQQINGPVYGGYCGLGRALCASPGWCCRVFCLLLWCWSLSINKPGCVTLFLYWHGCCLYGL